MTNIDFFIEEVNTESFTEDEYNNYQKKLNLPPLSFLIEKGIVKKTYVHDKDQFYRISAPISLYRGNRPLSRIESKGYGANYRFPARMEDAFYDILKKKVSINDVKKYFWNSTAARHFADGFDGKWNLWPTKQNFISYLYQNPSIIDSILSDIKKYKNKDDGIDEKYHSGNISTTLASFIGDMIKGFDLNPEYLRKNKELCVKSIFEETNLLKIYLI